MPGPYGQSRNPFGNHAGTKHRSDKQTGGANRGQGNITNEERKRRALEIKFTGIQLTASTSTLNYQVCSRLTIRPG